MPPHCLDHPARPWRFHQPGPGLHHKRLQESGQFPESGLNIIYEYVIPLLLVPLNEDLTLKHPWLYFGRMLKPLERPRRRWVDNIKMYLRELG
jgi:hypothetical protein